MKSSLVRVFLGLVALGVGVGAWLVFASGSDPLSGTADSRDAPADVEPADPDEGDDGDATEDPAAALPTECGNRLINPEHPIPARTFAGCIDTAQVAANTFHWTVKHDDGSSGEGWVDIANRRLYLVMHDDVGGRILSNGDDFWHYGAGRWVRAVAGSSDPREMQAHSLAQLMEAFSDPRVAIEAWASGEDFRRVGSTTTEVNGAETHSYRGLPDSWIPEVEVTGLEVWLDDGYRPMKYVASASGMGISTTTVTTFDSWGESLDIPGSPDEVKD